MSFCCEWWAEAGGWGLHTGVASEGALRAKLSKVPRTPEEEGEVPGRNRPCVSEASSFMQLLGRGTSLLTREPSGREEGAPEDGGWTGDHPGVLVLQLSGLRDSALCPTGSCWSGAPGAPSMRTRGRRVSTCYCNRAFDTSAICQPVGNPSPLGG